MKTIVAERRPLTGVTAKQVRRKGKVPGVLYGKGIKSLPIQMEAQELLKGIRENGLSRPFRLYIDSQEVPVMIAELQQNRLDSSVLHVDFKAIELKEEIETEVPLVVTGKPDTGQYLLHVHEIPIRCLPMEIPQAIHVCLDDLQAGDVVKAADLVLPKGVTLLLKAEAPIVTIEDKQELLVEETVGEREAAATLQAS
jgi:large subunit ribosomal protein L25